MVKEEGQQAGLGTRLQGVEQKEGGSEAVAEDVTHTYGQIGNSEWWQHPSSLVEMRLGDFDISALYKTTGRTEELVQAAGGPVYGTEFNDTALIQMLTSV